MRKGGRDGVTFSFCSDFGVWQPVLVGFGSTHKAPIRKGEWEECALLSEACLESLSS